jgi:hypothetical protein
MDDGKKGSCDVTVKQIRTHKKIYSERKSLQEINFLKKNSHFSQTRAIIKMSQATLNYD